MGQLGRATEPLAAVLGALPAVLCAALIQVPLEGCQAGEDRRHKLARGVVVSAHGSLSDLNFPRWIDPYKALPWPQSGTSRTPDRSGNHAYFPALITCIAFLDLLSGLHAGKLEGHGLTELQAYVSSFMDRSEYNEDRINVLYECFRHKVAHLGLPYAVFDTDTSRGQTFANRPRRLITWTVDEAQRRPAIEIVPERPQILTAVTPWPVYYDHRVIVSISSLASDIVNSIPNYLGNLVADSTACSNFKKCMESYFPR